MAHFAKIEDNLVTQVIVVDNSDILDESNNESEALGIKICQDLFSFYSSYKLGTCTYS